MKYFLTVLLMFIISTGMMFGISDDAFLKLPRTLKVYGTILLAVWMAIILICIAVKFPGSKPVLITVSIIFFLQALTTVGFYTTAGIFSIKDKPQNLKPETITAQGEMLGKVLIVYHPGVSGLTKKVVRSFGNGMASKGYDVTIESAGSKIKSKLEDYKMVVLSSPVYLGKPRPPLKEFIQNNSLNGLPVYVVLTGSHTRRVQPELAKIAPLIKDAGWNLIGNEKYTKKVSLSDIYNRGAEVAAEIK